MTGEMGLHRLGVILWSIIFLSVHSIYSAPVYDEDTTQIAEYEGVGTGCHYNFQDYEEGDRIMTNEPCLNCTCHNRMLMCYLRVCPQFTKAIGQNCKVEKRPDQCCPVITCPEVPVQLLTSTTSAPSDLTEVGFHDNYGCSIDDKFYADGAQLPTDPNNPCELCYCIRNRTTCTMQQCTLNIAQCNPVYHVGICCPVKYDCDYNEDTKTTLSTTPGLIMTTTITPDLIAPRCLYKGKMFNDGDLLDSTAPCHHCYCFRGDITCAIQDCGKPMETHGKNCTASTPPEGECCPTTYECEDTNESTEEENQQKVIHDENEIVATQASLPMKETDEEELPGVNNAISQDSQVHEEITIKSIETITTTQSIEITTEQENNQVPEKETPTSVIESNDVPQESIMPISHVDEAAQPIDKFHIPPKPIESVEVIEQAQPTTIGNEVDTMKTPTKEKPASVPEVHTESSISPSEKPSTNLPARSEDQFPSQQSTSQPEEILTNVPNSQNEFSETAVTVPVITETENNNKVEEKPITYAFDGNEIPKVSKSDEEPKLEETAPHQETSTIKAVDEIEEQKPEVTETEVSSPEMPQTSTESKPENESSKTELPHVVNEDELTTHSSAVPYITNAIPEQDSTITSELENTPEEAATTHSITEQPMPTQTVPTTEIIESEMTDIPTEGPSGIATVSHDSVNKVDDNESVTEVQVTEGYDKQRVSEETQMAENLITDKPVKPMETSTEALIPKEEEKTEKPQISDVESTVLVTEAATIEPDAQTPEHIQRISPTPVETTATRNPIEHDVHSTQAVESAETPTTYSTESSEGETPMKGLEVSGEQSSEEAMSAETSTEADKQPDSSDNSLEEESEKTNSPLTPLEQSISTEYSTEAENNITTEKQITEIPMKKETNISSDEEKPSAGVPVEEISTKETLTEEELMKEKPAEKESTVVTSESVEETQPVDEQPVRTEQDQTTLHPQELPTTIIEDEILTSTFNESSSTSVPVNIKHTEGTTILEDLSGTSTTAVIHESTTENTDTDKMSDDKHQSTELPLPQENATEIEQSIHPVVDEMLGMKPTDESVSMSEQPTTEFEKSDDAVKQQTELPIASEEIKPTEISVVEETAEGASSTPIDLSETELAEEKSTASSITEKQTIGGVTQPTINEEDTSAKDEVQQTQTSSIIPGEIEMAVTTESAISEKEPSEQIATSTEQDLKSEEKPIEAITVAVPVSATDESSTDAQVELKPKESSSEKTHVTPLLTDQEKSTEMSISETQPISITTESLISEEKSTESTITSEIMPVTEQQPNEEPVKITEIPVDVSTDDTVRTESTISEVNSSEEPKSTPAGLEPEETPIEVSVANVTHTELIPIEITEEPTVSSISTKEPMLQVASEFPIKSTTIENTESNEFHETPESPNKSVTEQSAVNEETTINSEPPKTSISTEASTESVTADEQTMVFDNQKTEKPEKDQEESFVQTEISPSVTTTSTVAIEEGTTSPTLDETEIPVEEVQAATDVPISDLSTESPTKEEKPQAVPELIPPTEQPFGTSTDSSIQSVESTDKLSKEQSSSTEASDEILSTTSEDFKPSGIPGEGYCLIDGETYTNNSVIPPMNSCQLSCRCLSSIVQCESVQCPPPPKHNPNCVPVLMRGETCCPTYICENVTTSPLEAENQMAEEHTMTGEQVDEQKTKAPPTDEVSSDDTTTADEGTKSPEEQITLLNDEKKSSMAPAESSSTVESGTNVTDEESYITPETPSESTEHTESPAIITEESITEIGITLTTSPPDGIEITELNESDKKHIVPTFDNRINEHDKVTTAPEEEMNIKEKPTSDPHSPKSEGEEEGVTVLNADEHSISTVDNMKIESVTSSTEEMDKSSTSTEVNDKVSTDTSESVTQSSSEAQDITTIGEEISVTEENTTTTIVENPIENIEDTSEKLHEEYPSSEHPSELTPISSVTESFTENSATEKTEVPSSEMNKPNDNISSSDEERTTESISPDIGTTISSIIKKPDVEVPNEILPVSDTVTETSTDEHKEDVSEKPIESPKTELPKEQGITIVPADDKISVPAIPQEHSIIDENTTAGSIVEETTEPFVIPEEQAGISTKSSQPLETTTESAVVQDTSESTEPVVSSESASPSIAPESSEQTKPAITEIYNEQSVESSTSELTETPISKFDDATTPLITEAEVNETPGVAISKPEDEHTLDSELPSVTEIEETSEETTETASSSTESSISQSQFIKDEAEQSLTTPLASIVPVESELLDEKDHTESQEKTTESTTSIAQTPEIEISQNETATTSNEASDTPIAADEQSSEEPMRTQPPLTQETSSEHINTSVIGNDETTEVTTSPIEEETSSISVSPELSLVPKIPSEEHKLVTEASVETATDIPNKESSTGVSAEATEPPTTPSVMLDTTKFKPVSQEKPIETSVENEKNNTTEIKGETTVPTLEEMSTTKITEETESFETVPSIEDTPLTAPSTTTESFTESEEISHTTFAHEKQTDIVTDVSDELATTPAIVSSTKEAVTQAVVEELTTQPSTESFDEHTMTPVKLETPEKNPVIETHPSKEPEHTTDETKPANVPSGPIENDIQHQIPDPSLIFEHAENETQQAINPFESEIVQEHVTETEKNLTSLDHGYIPPSTTETSTGGEYPEHSVSGEDNPYFPINSGTHLNPEEDYDEDDQAVYGPGTCRYGGKVYVSAQQIPRDDPCDFCFCFRGDIICLQQSCPPPIPGCHEEPISGFCCPRYECPVSMATSLNITTTTTTTTTTLPPHFLSHAYKGATRRSGCQIRGQAYKIGEVIQSASGPCLHCICGGDGNMKCEPRVCTPEPMIRQMIAAATAKRRR